MRDLLRKIAGAFDMNGRDAKGFVVSLLLAFGIWLIYNMSQSYTELVSIPVRAKSDISGHSLVSANSTVVLIRCRASGFNIVNLYRAKKRLPLVLELSSSELRSYGDDRYYVTSSDLEKHASKLLGSESKVESFVSDTLMFHFPIVNHKTVPVVAVNTISFKSQYTNTENLRTIPDSVIIYGEPYLIEDITQVHTEHIALNNLKSPASGIARLERIKGVRISEESVRYAMDVVRYVDITETFPVYVKNAPAGKLLTVFPSSVEVTFRCIFPIKMIKSDAIKVTVDYKDFEQSLAGQCIPVVSGMPANVFDYKVKPAVIDCMESDRI